MQLKDISFRFVHLYSIFTVGGKRFYFEIWVLWCRILSGTFCHLRDQTQTRYSPWSTAEALQGRAESAAAYSSQPEREGSSRAAAVSQQLQHLYIILPGRGSENDLNISLRGNNWSRTRHPAPGATLKTRPDESNLARRLILVQYLTSS